MPDLYLAVTPGGIFPYSDPAPGLLRLSSEHVPAFLEHEAKGGVVAIAPGEVQLLDAAGVVRAALPVEEVSGG